jgi:hypothetical protein
MLKALRRIPFKKITLGYSRPHHSRFTTCAFAESFSSMASVGSLYVLTKVINPRPSTPLGRARLVFESAEVALHTARIVRSLHVAEY